MADIHPRNKNVANTEKLYEFLMIDVHENAFNCWASLDKRLITWFSHWLFLCTKNNLGIQLKKGHWLWPLVKKRNINAKAETVTNSFFTASTASCRSDDSYYIIPSLSLLPFNKSRFLLSSGRAAHYWQVPGTLWDSASSLARINPLTSQGSSLAWLDLASG